MSQLRKKTGFSIANCRKALQQFDNDLEAAEKWLVDEAQRQGWEKSTKLAGRDANQVRGVPPPRFTYPDDTDKI